MHEGYEELRCAIVKQAVVEYRRALKYGNKHSIKSLERWFLSDWGQTLSCNNGARIIETVKQEVYSDKNYKKKIIPRENLRLFRENLGLNKSEISKIIGCSAPYYGEVENGRQRGSNKFWDKLHAAYPSADIGGLMDNGR